MMINFPLVERLSVEQLSPSICVSESPCNCSICINGGLHCAAEVGVIPQWWGDRNRDSFNHLIIMTISGIKSVSPPENCSLWRDLNGTEEMKLSQSPF
jgi:hypothetical protein